MIGGSDDAPKEQTQKCYNEDIMDKLTFNAEVKKVEAKKLASLDVAYQVVLYTDNPSVLALGALNGDSILNVSVEVENG